MGPRRTYGEKKRGVGEFLLYPLALTDPHVCSPRKAYWKDAPPPPLTPDMVGWVRPVGQMISLLSCPPPPRPCHRS